MLGLLGIVFFILSCISVPAALAADEIEVTANRPGVAHTADVTQEGVLEMDYGWERAFRGHEFKTLSAASGILRFGLTEDLELRLDMQNYLSQHSFDHKGRRSGVGDTSPGFKYRFIEEEGLVPTLSFAYEVKIPTASRRKGLGTGRVDHNLDFLASKELIGLEWNFDYHLGIVGKEGEKGFDDFHLFALSFSRPLFGPVGIWGEIYKGLNIKRAPGITSTDWALTYQLTPRVVFDVGVDVGLNAAARDITYFTGLSIALVDLYRLFGLKN